MGGAGASYADVQALVAGMEGLTPAQMKGILTAAKSMESGGKVNADKLGKDIPRILKNATKV